MKLQDSKNNPNFHSYELNILRGILDSKDWKKMPIRLPILVTEENYPLHSVRHKRNDDEQSKKAKTLQQWQYGITTQTLLRYSEWYRQRCKNQSVTLQASQNGNPVNKYDFVITKTVRVWIQRVNSTMLFHHRQLCSRNYNAFKCREAN